MKFILGIAVGFFVGLLIAPRSGEETRELLMDRAGEIAEAPQRRVEERIREIARASEEKAGEIGSEVGKNTAQAAVRTIADEMLGDTQHSKRA